MGICLLMNLGIAAVVYAAWSSTHAQRSPFPAGERYVPEFTAAIAKQFPACDASTHNLRDKLVQHLDGSITVMSFDDALALTERSDAWVLGSC